MMTAGLFETPFLNSGNTGLYKIYLYMLSDLVCMATWGGQNAYLVTVYLEQGKTWTVGSYIEENRGRYSLLSPF